MSAEPTTVYLATVSTRDEIVAVAETAERAVLLACRLAVKYLNRDGYQHECRTANQVRDFFGVRAIPLVVGEATHTDSLW